MPKRLLSGVVVSTNSNKTMVDARATYHNLTINSDGSNKEVELNNLAATIEGDLTVQEGKLFTYATSGRHLTVTGDVSIEDGGEIDMNNAAGMHEDELLALNENPDDYAIIPISNAMERMQIFRDEEE